MSRFWVDCSRARRARLLAAALFAFNACVSFFVGWRSFRRAEFPSYQVKAAGKSLDQLSPGVRTVVLAHAILSFGYNTAILALGVNLASSLLNAH